MNLWQKIMYSKKRLIGIVAILAIVVTVPLTVFISQKQQEIRQRASETGDTFRVGPSPAITINTIFDVDLILEAGTNNVPGVDVTILSSDVNNLEITKFTPSTAYPTVVKNILDAGKSFRYTGVNLTSTPKTGAITLGTISLKIKNSAGGSISVDKPNSIVIIAGSTTPFSITNTTPLATYSLSSPTTATTPTPRLFPVNEIFEAKDGTITAPFQVNGGFVYQTVTTAIPSAGGKAAYLINIPAVPAGGGDYLVEAKTSSVDTGSNSFFVNFDTEPTTANIWHTPVGGGINNVRWGEDLSPKVFNLTAGNHTLIFRGREPNTKLYQIKVVKSPPPNSLVGHWKLNDGTGSITAKDSTDYKHDGFLVNSPAWESNGCVTGMDKCLSLSGVTPLSPFVRIPTTVADTSKAHTYSLWAKPTALPGNGGLFGDWTGGTYNGTMFYEWGSSGPNTLCAYVSITSGSAKQTAICATPTLNQWHHFALTYNGSGEMRYYVDGVPFGSEVTIPDGGRVQDGGDFFIGTYNNCATCGFKGLINEVKVYNYARSGAQVKADYDEHAPIVTPTPALVGYWKMDESAWVGTNNEVIDSSGNTNHGTATRAIIGAGKYGNGGVFATNYVTVTDPASGVLDFGTNNFSVAYWIKANLQTNQNSIPVGKGNKDCLTAGYRFIANAGGAGSNLMQFALSDGTGTGGCGNTNHTTNFTGALDNTWHHLVATVDRANNVIKIYLDGAAKTTNTITTTGSVSNATNLGIGNGLYGAGAEFAGSLDELRIYNYSLSPKEVSDLYNWAPSGNPPVGHWKLNDVSGNTAPDSSNYNHPGALKNSPEIKTKEDGCLLNKCLSFSGVTPLSPFVQISDAVLDTSKTHTYSLWAKPTALPGNRGLFGDWAGGEYNGTMFYGLGRSLCAHTSIWIDQNSVRVAICTEPALNQWHHFVLTYDNNYFFSRFGISGYRGNLEYYVDGVLIGSERIPDNKRVLDGKDFYIGTYNNCATCGFNGLINDVKVYNYVRNQAQVLQDYNEHPREGVILSLDLQLQGIGSGNGENPDPKTLTRTATIQVFDSSNKKVGEDKNKTGGVTYDKTSKTFKGNVNVGVLPAGNYTFKVKTDKYLNKAIPGVYSVAAVQTTPILTPQVKLLLGDINGDNKIDILDYNAYLVCVNRAAIETCINTDLNDDGSNDARTYGPSGMRIDSDMRLLFQSFGEHEGD